MTCSLEFSHRIAENVSNHAGLPQTSFAPGQTIPLTFYYRVDHPTQQDLQFRVNVRGPAGFRPPMDFHGWHYPLQSSYPTNRWRRGEILRDPSPIVIPPDLRTPVHIRLTLTVLPRGGGGAIHYRQDNQNGHELPLAEIDIRGAPP